jgi:KDO2-lipid IV(A) lauroyltransferase
MPKKPRKPALDFAVYVAVRLVVAVIQALPPAYAFRLAEVLAWVAYMVDRRHRAVAADNLRHAFPEMTPARVDGLVRATYRHFLRMVVEIALLPRKLRPATWRRYVNFGPGTAMLRPALTGRPMMLVTGHFGNWELAGYLTGVFGFQTFAIARVLDNARLERWLKWFRQKTGQTIIAKKDDFDRLTTALRAGGIVGTLADQDAGSRGVFVDFFGRPAAAHKAVALMALEFGAVLVVVGMPRVAEPMFYAVEVEDVIDPNEYATRPDAVKAITARYTAALERLIRRHPEQYFWLHRRWKTRPAEKRAKAAAGPRAA